jgi:pilus assembly protein CpaF
MASLRDQIALWNYGSRAKAKPLADPEIEKNPPSAGEAVTSPAEHAEKPESALSVPPPTKGQGTAFYSLKTKLHQKLLTRIDLAAAEALAPEQLRTQLRDLVTVLIEEDSLPVNEKERSQLVTELQNEIMGLGPLEPLLADPSISEIMVNGYQNVYIERRGQIELSKVRFNDDAHLLKIIDKIVSRVGRRIDESSPMADARLPDGSRVNAIIPPLALDGPSLSIRRFAVVPLEMKDLIAKKALTAGMAELLAGMVKAKTNIVISGGTGSGKTTLLNILSSYIPVNERIITIEDTAELQLQQDHVVRLETRPPNIEGKGEIPMRLLVKNSLRMRPDRIVLGEVRGGEVIDMLQAMNTGHDGSLTTVHANSPRDALARLENLVGMGGVNLPAKALRQLIASSINVIVQATRLNDGSRKITSVQEITGMEGDVITSQEIFYFERLGVNPDGSVMGRFRATGVRPLMAEKLRTYGINLGEELFDPSRPLE